MYSIHELSRLAGISPRTLRYYDEIGLLKPSRTEPSGYRFYGEAELNLLQQILFYRERGLGLDRIREILYREDFDLMTALEDHLRDLEARRTRMDDLIRTVEHTIASLKGENTMANSEKFAAFKKQLIEENEAKYGKEIREKYGNEAIDGSNRQLLGMTEEGYSDFQSLEAEILRRLQEGVKAGIAADSDEAKTIVSLHRRWIEMTWKPGAYTPAAHRGLAAMYLADDRFRAYYDKEVPGCAELLTAAIQRWA